MKKTLLSFIAPLVVLTIAVIFVVPGKVNAAPMVSCSAPSGQVSIGQPVRWAGSYSGGLNYLGQPEATPYFIWSGTDIYNTGTSSSVLDVTYNTLGEKTMSITYVTFARDSVFPYSVIGVSLGQECINKVTVVNATTTQSITVQSPNGGETYNVGDILKINWSSKGFSSTTPISIALEDTRQTGDTPARYMYITGTSTVPNSGIYYWKIVSSPYMTVGAGNVYKVVVASSEGLSEGSIGDASDATFTINSLTPPTTTPCYNFTTNLQLGNGGVRNEVNIPAVTELQKFLVSKGYNTQVTGYFGINTYFAVRAYQKDKGIPITGLVEYKTIDALNKDCGGTIPVPIPPVVPTVYPGFYISFSKNTYSSDENIVATLSRADGSSSPYNVDAYIFSSNTEPIPLKSISIGQGTKLSFQMDQQLVAYKGPGNYTLLICDGGQKCNGGVNTNAIGFKITEIINIAPVAKLISADIQSVDNGIDNTSIAAGTIKFSIYSPSSDIMVSRKNVNEVVRTIFAGTDVGGVSSAVLTAITSPSTSDTADYFTIKAGVTRHFTISFVIEPIKGTGQYSARLGKLSLVGGESIVFGDEFKTQYIALIGENFDPLVVSCSSSVVNSGKPTVKWFSKVSGGQSPYKYSWSIYNDVSNYGRGSGSSSWFEVFYSTVGTKDAYLVVTDSANRKSSAKCSGTIQPYFFNGSGDYQTTLMPKDTIGGGSTIFTASIWSAIVDYLVPINYR